MDRNSLKPVEQLNRIIFPKGRTGRSPLAEPAREEPGRILPAAGERVLLVDRKAQEDEIDRLEAHLAERPGEFSWLAHNELRQLYLTFNERKSMQHAEAILANSVMDAHILNALADGHLESAARFYSPGLAVVALLDKAGRYPDLAHLCTACLIKAGDLQAAQSRLIEAQRLYRWALSLTQAHSPSSLEAYLTLAHSRLDTFRL